MEEQKQPIEKGMQAPNKKANSESKTFFYALARTIMFIGVVVIISILYVAYRSYRSGDSAYSLMPFVFVAMFGFPFVVVVATVLNFTKSISKKHTLIVEAAILVAIISILSFM